VPAVIGMDARNYIGKGCVGTGVSPVQSFDCEQSAYAKQSPAFAGLLFFEIS